MKKDITLLLVEDSMIDAAFILGMLKTIDGYTFKVTHKEYLTEAIQYLDLNSVDLIILDLELPDSSGIDSLKSLYKKYTNIPIIVLTSNKIEEISIQAVNIGAQDFLIKGRVNPSLFLRSILYAIERKKAEIRLRNSEQRFRNLFEDAPISLWEQDFSKVKKQLDNLIDADIDVSKYLSENKKKLLEMLNSIKILDVNNATLNLFKATSKEDLKKNVTTIFTDKFLNTMREVFIRASTGNILFESRTVLKTLTGENKHIYLKGFTASGFEKSMSKIIISMIDISDLKEVQDQLFAQWRLLSSINRVFVKSMNCDHESEIIHLCLKELMDLTSSEFAFYIENFNDYNIKTISYSGKDLIYDQNLCNPILHEKSAKILWDDIDREKHTLIYDVEKDNNILFNEEIVVKNINTLMSAPLFHGNDNNSMIGLGNKIDDYNFFDQQSIESLAVAFREALTNKRHEDNLTIAKDELTVLHEISMLISQSMNLKNLFGSLLASISKLHFLKSLQGSCVLLKKDEFFSLSTVMGIDEDVVLGFLDTLNKKIRNGDIPIEQIPYEQSSTDSQFKFIDDSFGHVIVPLKSSNEISGILLIFLARDFDPLEERQIQVLSSLGNQIGVAIENIELFEETKRLSLHDPLTTLSNRRSIEIIIRDIYARSKRHKRPFSLLLLDIDFFKNFNDTYGHKKGDEILQAVAETLKNQFRDIDLVGRYGGEEFIVVLSEIDIHGAELVAQRVRQAIEDNTEVTVSVGVASYDDDVSCEDDLINMADIALYKAKENGRNRVELYKRK